MLTPEQVRDRINAANDAEIEIVFLQRSKDIRYNKFDARTIREFREKTESCDHLNYSQIAIVKSILSKYARQFAALTGYKEPAKQLVSNTITRQKTRATRPTRQKKNAMIMSF